MDALDENVTTKELQFFHGKPREWRKAILGRQYLDDSNIKCAYFFEKLKCQNLMRRNIMSIHRNTGNIFLDNETSGESICNFFSAQHD